MTLVKLSGAAEYCIGALHLNPPNEEIVRTCVSRYTMPNTFCEFLSYIVSRIVDAITHIFGCSYWQNAENAIYESILRLSIEQNLIKENPSTKLEKIMNAKIPELIHSFAEKILSFCCDQKEENTPFYQELREDFLKLTPQGAINFLKENLFASQRAD